MTIIFQLVLLLLLSPLVTGTIKNWKAKLQNRRGPPLWQPYSDLAKFLRKDMVISEHASWIFSAAPHIIFLSVLVAGLMVPTIFVAAPLQWFGGAIALVGLLALGRFFLALGGLDPGSAFGGMGSSREMSLSSVTEPALMLSVFTVAIAAGSTNLSRIVEHSADQTWPLLNPANLLSFVALFIVTIAETGRVPVDNPATHLELTMIHEAMVLEYSGRYLALLEWAASIKQLVLMALLVNVFFPIGIAGTNTFPAAALSTVCFLAKIFAVCIAVVLVESSNAKLRLFRVPELLSGAFILAALALLSTFIFR